jgi:para-aminobenzoate synthetase component 1
MSPLADHKTLNYLYYHQAGDWARARGADEAVILNPDGSVSETNTAGILVVSGKTVIRPRSPHVLPSVMQDEICTRFINLEFTAIEREMQPDDLLNADTVLLTNALMGAVPALSLDGRRLKVNTILVTALNRHLFQPEESGDGLR